MGYIHKNNGLTRRICKKSKDLEVAPAGGKHLSRFQAQIGCKVFFEKNCCLFQQKIDIRLPVFDVCFAEGALLSSGRIERSRKGSIQNPYRTLLF